MVKVISKITEAEARIHAHVCGDGSIYTYTCKRSPADLRTHLRKNISRKLYCVKYCNSEPVLLDCFEKDIKNVYSLKTSFSRNEHLIRAKWVYIRLRELGAGNSKNWFVSDKILNSNSIILKEWLKAFFDDEGHVDIKSNYITLNSVNLNGLKQVKLLLQSLGIENVTIKGPYFYKQFYSYRLKILKRDLKKFQQKIGFNHPKKIIQLAKLLNS